jgi:hypothetical protein
MTFVHNMEQDSVSLHQEKLKISGEELAIQVCVSVFGLEISQ